MSGCQGSSINGKEDSTLIDGVFGDIKARDARKARDDGTFTTADQRGPNSRSKIQNYMPDSGGLTPVDSDDASTAGQYTLNFENTDIKDVVRAVLNDALKVNYTINGDVSGPVSISTVRPVSREALLKTLESSLASFGFSLIKTGSGYRVTATETSAGTVDNGRKVRAGYGVSIVPLKFLPASSVMEMLNGFVAPAEGLRINAAGNSLIVRGTLAQIEQVKRLVGELDVPRKQIELSLWIIDIKKTELDRLGVNWSGGINIGNRLAIGINQSPSVSTLDGSRFLASVQAMASKGDAHIVSRPVLLTQENIPAYFDSNQTFYAQLVGDRAVSLEQVTYGTLVSVHPRISSGNEVEIQLKIEDGAADGTRSVASLPVVNRTLIDTVARVPQQLSLLVGGYTRSQSEQGYSGIPGLRRIPGVGKLFGQDSTTSESLVRVFLIQPRLLAGSDPVEGPCMPEVYGPGVGESVRDALRGLHPQLSAGEVADGDAAGH